MTRCICNNYDIEGFWRNWHASYNQWLVSAIVTVQMGTSMGAWDPCPLNPVNIN